MTTIRIYPSSDRVRAFKEAIDFALRVNGESRVAEMFSLLNNARPAWLHEYETAMSVSATGAK